MPVINWTDITVIVVIGVFTIIGLRNGFLYSVFRLLSYIIALVVAVKAYPILSSALQKTILYDKIKVYVINSIQGANAAAAASAGSNTTSSAVAHATSTAAQATSAAHAASAGVHATSSASHVTSAAVHGASTAHAATASAISDSGLQMSQSAIQNIKLPDFLKTSIINDVAQKGLETKAAILDAIGHEISMLIINIISMLLIYVLIRFGLMFARIIIRAVSSLPIFKQLDRAGGIALGAVEGILVVYVLCAFITLFSASPAFNSAINSVKQARFAHYFYENNFIVSWLTPDEQLDSTSAHQTNPINSTSNQESNKP